VAVMDLTGRMVMQERLVGTGAVSRIDLAHLQNGLYTVVFATADRTEKITVQLMR
jgi:hypothetical protein